MASKYTDSNFNQIAITGPFGFPLKNTEGAENEIRVAKKDGRYALAIKTDNAWRYFDENKKAASASTLGLVKVGSGLSINAEGVLSATGGGGSGTITGVTAGTGLSGGGTTGDITLTNAGVTSNVAGTGIAVSAATGAVTISVSGLTVSELAANSLQTSGESFSDNDTSLMTSAAIQDKIQSFSYITLSSLSASAPITYDNSSGALSIADHAVALAKLPEIATARFLGRNTSGTGDVEVMTVTQVGALLNLDNYLTAPRTVTAGGNTLASSETLAFTEGSNITITESGGAVTITATDTNTTDLNTLSAGVINTSNDSFGFIDADDSNASKKESIADFLTAIAGSGISASSGQLSRDSMALNQLSNVSSSSPSTGDFLKYGGSQWEPTAVSVMTSWKLRDSSNASNDKTVSDGKFVKIIATNSGSYGDVAFSGSTGATDDPFVVSISAPNTDRYVNSASFNTSNGVLTLTRAGSDSATVTVDLDGRYLENLTGTSIKTLLDVASNSPSNGQILQWNSTANYYEPVTLTSSYSWYLRDGDTTSVQVTSGKYVKLVEGNNLIDINFTDTDSGAVDDEFDITFTVNSSNITSLGTITSGTWNGGVIASAYLDADTAHLSGSTFTGTVSLGDLDIIPTSSNISVIKHDSGSGSLTLRGDQIRLQNRDGDDTGLTYNDGSGLIGRANTHISYTAGQATSTATGGAFIAQGSDIITGRVFFQGYQNGGGDLVGFNNESDKFVMYNYTDNNYIAKFGYTGSITAIGSISTGDGDHTFTSLSNVHLELKGGHSAAVGLKLVSGSTLRGWVYANDSYQQGFLTTAGQWALRKDNDGQLILRVSGAEQTVHHTSNLGAWADSNRNFRFGSPTNTNGQGLMGQRNDGTFQWQLYGDGSNVGFLDGAFAAWDLKKALNGSLYVYGSGSNVATFGSADAWGRIQHESGFTNGVYVYTQHGNFRVDGGNWNCYTDADHDLGASQTAERWRNLYLASQIVGGFGARTTGGTTNWNDSSNARSGAGYTLLLGNHSNGPSGTGDYFHPHSYEYNSKDGGGNMCQFAIPYIVGNGGGMYMRSRYSGSWGGWVQFHDNDNMSGVARTGNTYGSFNITNGNNAWAGHTYSTHSSKPTWMHKDNHGEGGLYYQTAGKWAIYWSVSNDCLGVDGSTTSSSYGLYVSGAIYSTGDVVAFSDARVKTNVVTIDNPLDKVLNMRGVYYNPIDKKTKKVDDRRRVGVIAQELNEVLPEAVTYAEDIDEYGVDYGKLTGILIEAIKELKQEINELKGS